MSENELEDSSLPDDVYREERNSLVDAEREGSRSFDKAVLTLSAGALGLSITFLRQIAPSPIPGTVVVLIFAWIAFGLSVLCTLSSFLTSQRAIGRQREILDEIYSKKIPNENWSGLKNPWSTVTSILNVISREQGRGLWEQSR